MKILHRYTGAVLYDGTLRNALRAGANLGGANLRGANLRGANLGDAYLGGANLGGANLGAIRDDFRALISSAPAEIPALRAALVEGRVDGSLYEGDCACLVGTIANARGCHYRHVAGLTPDAHRPAERFALAVSPGDTPETSQVSALLVQWIDEWAAERAEGRRIP